MITACWERLSHESPVVTTLSPTIIRDFFDFSYKPSEQLKLTTKQT